ncbi:MAG TPA: SpoIID/LytB domain-containing protein [Elusimicrobiota bacterium]|nr:SpoIID/LytB domain-containing protein [Elusimicrobiota bacterium]
MSVNRMLAVVVILSLPVLTSAEDGDKAVARYQQLVREQPNNPSHLLNLGILLNETGSPDKAYHVLVRSERLMPGNAFLLRQLGWTCFSKENYRQAIRYFKKAISIDPLGWESYAGLGWSYLNIRQNTDAIAALEKAREINPGSSMPLVLMARFYQSRGDIDTARQLYETAEKTDYRLPEVKAERLSMDQPSSPLSWMGKTKRKLKSVKPSLDFMDKSSAEAVLDTDSDADSEEILPKAFLPGRGSKPLKEKWITTLNVGLFCNNQGDPVALDEIRFFSRGPFRIVSERSRQLLVHSTTEGLWRVHRKKDTLLITGPKSQKVVTVREPSVRVIPEKSADPIVIQRGGRERLYRGTLEIRRHGGGLRVINHVSMSDYLLSVIPAEMDEESPTEALKAQAVLARSFALSRRTHLDQGYDLCDGQHCQVYRGGYFDNEKLKRVIEDTPREVLTYDGKVAQTVYSSNCGGQTQDSRELSGWGDVPYWQSVTDAPFTRIVRTPLEHEMWIRGVPAVYCRPSPYVFPAEARWVRIIPEEVLRARLEKSYKNIGRIKKLRVRRRSQSGHVNAVEVVGTEQTIVIDKEHKIRSQLAPGGLRSTLFTVQVHYHRGRAVEFIFWGGGWGHGLGLCQSGATGMAAKGKNYRTILRHYFPLCRLEKMAQ